MKQSEKNNSFREYSQYIGIGMQLAIAAVVFFFLGKWLDDTYQTKPWFSLIGIMFGSIGGFISFFKKVTEMEKKAKNK